MTKTIICHNRSRAFYQRILLFFFCVALQPARSHADIIEVNSFSTLYQTIVAEAHPESVVLFDVDGVLIEPTDAFNFRSQVRKALNKKLRKNKSKKEIQKIFSDFFKKRQVKLVHLKMPLLISFLKKNRIPVSVLSAWWTNRFGTIEKMEAERFRGLNQVGLSFSELSPFKKDIAFASHKKINGGTPMIISGIILTALQSKGKILDLVLKNTKCTFKKIIFIDDQIEELQRVEKACHNKASNLSGFIIPKPQDILFLCSTLKKKG
jgi:hypothetical protein